MTATSGAAKTQLSICVLTNAIDSDQIQSIRFKVSGSNARRTEYL
jgi:hypothetical protein